MIFIRERFPRRSPNTLYTHVHVHVNVPYVERIRGVVCSPTLFRADASPLAPIFAGPLARAMKGSGRRVRCPRRGWGYCVTIERGGPPWRDLGRARIYSEARTDAVGRVFPSSRELTRFRRPSASSPRSHRCRLVYLSRRELRKIKFRPTVRRN